MNQLLIVAILLISTAPLFAQGQQPDPAKLKADARNAVGIIGSNKDKTRTYCEIVDLLGRQLGQADQKDKRAHQRDKRANQKDKNKTEASLQKINQLQKKLGPEYAVLENILEEIDLKSPDGREIASIIQTLNESCPE